MTDKEKLIACSGQMCFDINPFNSTDRRVAWTDKTGH